MNADTCYLDLLVRVLTNEIYQDPPAGPHYLVGRKYDQRVREAGKDWPSVAHTMVGSRCLNQVRAAVEHLLGSGVPGDLVETGVWRGGVCILMRALLKVYREPSRRVWVADSFRGMPESNAAGDSELALHEFNDILAVSQEQVEENFRRYGLLDEQVVFLNGWFADTLPSAPIDRIALLRMDADLRSSTTDILNSLYDKVSPGGIIVVDDYSLPMCSEAVREFRDCNGITDPIQSIDDDAVWWCKGGTAPHVGLRVAAAGGSPWQ
ncbi:MAG: macrocin-O-methyltransferase [Amycolatopsis sp.]|uniref:TylF/MycF/NovP-related O-methyltransferase n=1 Tax=Amycolatopsis sp. TaxID=37632 RepID=UPI002622BB23|nr:TylF/MycF/NovP-related O-methyltransferase [Amycolatopsis sp.]MCU1686731.1 macrocin-O-methyltransferase [Amycolatopsis sp.]